MDSNHLSDLMPWIMLTALNTAILVDQQQKQRPLTSEEIEASHLRAMECAEALRAGYRHGLAHRSVGTQARSRRFPVFDRSIRP